MTDKELLEAAAKAAGIRPPPLNNWDDYWNPLVDDGDAFRLAVKLGLTVGHGDITVHGLHSEQGCWVESPNYSNVDELHGTDPCAATRRAITRAAAVLGEQK